jgi:hypothetical protein
MNALISHGFLKYGRRALPAVDFEMYQVLRLPLIKVLGRLVPPPMVVILVMIRLVLNAPLTSVFTPSKK